MVIHGETLFLGQTICNVDGHEGIGETVIQTDFSCQRLVSRFFCQLCKCLCTCFCFGVQRQDGFGHGGVYTEGGKLYELGQPNFLFAASGDGGELQLIIDCTNHVHQSAPGLIACLPEVADFMIAEQLPGLMDVCKPCGIYIFVLTNADAHGVICKCNLGFAFKVFDDVAYHAAVFQHHEAFHGVIHNIRNIACLCAVSLGAQKQLEGDVFCDDADCIFELVIC